MAFCGYTVKSYIMVGEHNHFLHYASWIAGELSSWPGFWGDSDFLHDGEVCHLRNVAKTLATNEIFLIWMVDLRNQNHTRGKTPIF